MDQARDRKANEVLADGACALTNVDAMDSICHDVNSALATIVLCVDFLASQAAHGDTPALSDARNGIRVVACEMKKLRELARAARANASGSGVFRV